MHRPKNLKTLIFLDSGDWQDTTKALDALGFLDGQTTNPSLIAKSPTAIARLETGKKFEKSELLDFYQQTVQHIQVLIPEGSVSIEVFADANSTDSELLKQAKQMQSWAKNNHIKFPIVKAGVQAASQIVVDSGSVNMTLCFNQSQALAVHLAMSGATLTNQVLISPFVGRLNDQGLDGLSLIKNIQRMYNLLNSPVQILAASIRSLEDFLELLAMEVDIITAPVNILEEWGKLGMPIPEPKSSLRSGNLKSIDYLEFAPESNWQNLSLEDSMTDMGLVKFVKDWNALIV